eukprot:6010725-Pyramimonas_sp.AAC.2
MWWRPSVDTPCPCRWAMRVRSSPQRRTGCSVRCAQRPAGSASHLTGTSTPSTNTLCHTGGSTFDL